MPDEEIEKEEQETPSVEELQTQLSAEREKSSQLLTRLDRLEGLLIQQGVERGGEVEDDDTPAPTRKAAPREEEPDFETMTPKDQIRYVLGAIDEKLAAFGQNVEKRIASVQTESQARALVDDIADVMDTYGKENVVALQKEIVRYMADNKKLSVEDAYVLAARRAGKPIDAASKKPGPANEEGGSPRESLLRETDLPPRGPSKPVKREAQPTTFHEAGHSAWKKLGL